MKNMTPMALATALLAVCAVSGCATDAYGTNGHQPGYAKPIANLPYSEDDAITERVRKVLGADTRTGVVSLTIKATNGVVELGGTPKDQQARDLAIQMTERTVGVKSVSNKMVLN